MASLMAGIAEVQEVQASGSAQQRCALDFLLFRDIVQDHTAELQQAVLTACLLPVPTAAVLTLATLTMAVLTGAVLIVAVFSMAILTTGQRGAV